MPKLRNHSTEIGMFTEWLARKCRNHHPLQELGMNPGEKKPNMYKSKTKGDLGIVMDGEHNVILYTEKGRTFEIVVNEVPGDKYDETQLQKVAY